MVRSAALILLLVASCDNPRSRSDTDLAMRYGEQSAEMTQMRAELDDLKNQQQADHAQIATTEAVAADAASAVDSLRNTVNSNVKIDNDRAHGTYTLIQSVDRRLSRYDGQRTTTD